MEFEAWTGDLREKLIAHYSEKYEISYEVALGEEEIPVMLTMRNREPVTMLGFAMKNARLGPESGELLLLLPERVVGEDMPERVKALVSAVEKEYINPGRDHGFTLISVVIACESVAPGAVKPLKKLKAAREYPNGGGWIMTRVAAVSRSGILCCNGDGKALADLLKKEVL